MSNREVKLKLKQPKPLLAEFELGFFIKPASTTLASDLSINRGFIMSTKNDLLKKELLKKVGCRLKLERKRLGGNVIKISNHLDINPNTYRNYEAGKRDIHSSKLLLLSELGFDMAYIITGLKKSDIASQATVATKTNTNTRLIKDFDDTDTQADTNTDKNEVVVNELVKKMKAVEDTLLRAGAVSGEDYTYTDLATLAMKL